MNPPSAINHLLVAGGTLSALAAVMHLGCIVFGAPWYRFFGAGEQMARMAELGLWQPTVATLVIASALLVWSLYALSGAGLVRRLPLLRSVLVAITAVYLMRGLFGFLAMPAWVPGRSDAFWLWSSGICLLIGVVHLVGLWRAWPRLRPASPSVALEGVRP